MRSNKSQFDKLFNHADISKGLFVTGTDTDVGKTWVGCHLIQYLSKQGFDIAPRKPVESGWPENAASIQQTDAWKLANAANKLDQLDIICPNRFKAAISPSRAARLENKEVTLKQLTQQCLSQHQATQLLYVEGAGGFYSPLCEDGLNADLCEALQLPIILIAEDKLGCINHVLLSIAAIKQRHLKIIGVVLNQITTTNDINQNNVEDLRELLDCTVIAVK